MREFLAAILTVIAMGVLLIAYTLSGSRAAAAGAGGGFVQYDPRGDAYVLARPAVAEPVNWTGDPYNAAPHPPRRAEARSAKAGTGKRPR